MMKHVVSLKVVCGCAVASMALGTIAQGQVRPTFSIDVQSAQSGAPGPVNGILEGFGSGIRIDEGSILTPARPGPPGPNPPSFAAFGPLPPPGLMVGALPGAAGSVPGGLGIVPAGPLGGAVELDALSYGHDYGIELMFSVDEWAGGDFMLPPAPPNVLSEGALSGVFDAAADVFRYNGLVARTAPPPPALRPGNKDFIDGNGFPSPAVGLPGLGLLEPMPPGCGPACNGDNLDALDLNSRLIDVQGPIFFSLDSQFPDPLDGPFVNTGTAVGNGFSGSDIIVSRAGGVPAIYAIAGSLGLDLQGFDTDDLDALILQDNGDGLYDPAIDRILFSVRRGSAVIGSPDSMFGVPIEEGDVLSVPLPGGASPFPSIYIAAEALGLGTVRSGTNELTPFGDELDALDLFLLGDLDGDGFVGIADLNIILGNWNAPIPPGNPSADVNNDGFVGIADLNIVLGNWNAGAPLPPGGAAAVPEPATLAVIGLAGVVLLRRRR
jgi:PEP-CTERM motif